MIGSIAIFLLAAAAPNHMHAPTRLLGHYYREGWDRFKGDICQERGEGKAFGMVIEPNELRLGTDKYRIIFYENVLGDDIHLWVADTLGHVSLLHLSLTQPGGAVFVVSETEQARWLADNPDTVDAGVMGTFLRC